MVASASPADAPLSPLTLSDAWIRAVPPVSSSTAGYFQLHNGTDKPVTLEGFETDLAGGGEMHETYARPDGTSGMRRLSAVEVPAGESVHFRPGGKHLMLFRLAGPLERSARHELCLILGDGERLCADFEVR